MCRICAATPTGPRLLMRGTTPRRGPTGSLPSTTRTTSAAARWRVAAAARGRCACAARRRRAVGTSHESQPLAAGCAQPLHEVAGYLGGGVYGPGVRQLRRRRRVRSAGKDQRELDPDRAVHVHAVAHHAADARTHVRRIRRRFDSGLPVLTPRVRLLAHRGSSRHTAGVGSKARSSRTAQQGRTSAPSSSTSSRVTVLVAVIGAAATIVAAVIGLMKPDSASSPPLPLRLRRRPMRRPRALPYQRRLPLPGLAMTPRGRDSRRRTRSGRRSRGPMAWR